MATVEVFNYLNEVPGIHLALPTRCKLPECYSMVYFPYHVWPSMTIFSCANFISFEQFSQCI